MNKNFPKKKINKRAMMALKRAMMALRSLTCI
jgi:hypothetical protein